MILRNFKTIISLISFFTITTHIYAEEKIDIWKNNNTTKNIDNVSSNEIKKEEKITQNSPTKKQ